MYDWIIEADIYRYMTDPRTTERGPQRDRLLACLRKAEAGLEVQPTAIGEPTR